MPKRRFKTYQLSDIVTGDFSIKTAITRKIKSISKPMAPPQSQKKTATLPNKIGMGKYIETNVSFWN